jgi:hypothetical protein
MYRENDPEPEIFNRKEFFFFSLKVFSSYYPHFGKVKNKKKTLSKKVVGSPWIDPSDKKINFFCILMMKFVYFNDNILFEPDFIKIMLKSLKISQEK